MSRSAHIATWLGVVFLVTALMHTYLWWRLVAVWELSRPWRLTLTASIVLLALLFPLPFFANRYFPAPFREIVLWSGYLWMGLAFLLFMGLLAVEIPRLLLPSRLWSAGVAFLALGAAGAAYWNAAREPLVRTVRVELPSLPQGMSGTTILQITDLHAGGLIRQGQIDAIFRRANELKPDLIALTGDLVDGSAAHHAETVAAVGDLRAEHGVFFVTGNHEYYSGVSDWLDYLGKLGVRILRNERARIGTEKEGFDLAGIDDPNGIRFPGHGPDLAKALSGRNREVPLVLLSHNPKTVRESAAAGVGLQISGHTHGGQLWPFHLFARMVHSELNGRYRVDGTELYVSPGTGFWGPPMRLGTRAEITLFELVSAN